MPKKSKAERKEERVQSLESELAKEKRKNSELQQHKTIQLDEKQISSFLNELTERIEWSTNRIVDETPRITSTPTEHPKSDGISYFLKWIIAIPFFLFAIAVLISLQNLWGAMWDKGWPSRIGLFVVALAGFDCAAIGIELLREKDRNYIVSLFSALVALVALVVALVK